MQQHYLKLPTSFLTQTARNPTDGKHNNSSKKKAVAVRTAGCINKPKAISTAVFSLVTAAVTS